MKKLLNLQSSLPSIDTSWKDKTPVISTQTVRMVTNLWKTFLQIKLIFIVSNQKENIFFLRRPWSREKKLLIFKGSSKIFTQNTKLCQILLRYAISFHSSHLYQEIGTNRNPSFAVNLESPIIYSNDTSTVLVTLELCYKPVGIFQRVIKEK